MSGGQRQRLALAAATLHEPPLLLLDEPTSAVDPQSRREFWDSLFELAEAGTTILVSTHYMDEAERCHRLAILDRGRLAAEGPPRELMRAVPGAVLEVETAEPLAARRALESLPEMGSVTQLGVRLHAVMEDASPDVAGRVRAHLAAAGVQADVEQVGASLEDVFVAATRRGELRP
jgi:ABC-2 type transport system ATP-binding protein